MKKYFEELPPNERILKIIEDFFKPFFEKENFTFSKSQRRFKRKTGFFENHISLFNNRHNFGNESVDFQIYITIHSSEYYKWEKKFYLLEIKSPENAIDGEPCYAIKNWNKEYLDGTWYNFVDYDNQKIIDSIIKNFQNSAIPYFDNFSSLENGINYLIEKKNNGNFLLIFDLLMINEDFDLAIEFFEKNNSWFEDELKNCSDESYFAWNYKKNYLLRKVKYNEIKNNG